MLQRPWGSSARPGAQGPEDGDTEHLHGLRLTSVFLNRARRVFMAGGWRFSATQATWGSTRVGGDEGPGEQEGHLPPPPQKDSFLFPGPSRPYSRTQTQEAPAPNCCVSLAGLLPSLSSTFLILKKTGDDPLLTNLWSVFIEVLSIQ